MKNQSCSFTGHRPSKFPWKYNEKDSRCVELKSMLSLQIEKLASAGITDFYSGMALGVDCWAAMSVLALREKQPVVKLHCVLPCEGQSEKWMLSDQVQYQSILDNADSVEYVSRIYHKNCMLDRNRRLVDSAAFLLAVYNGEYRGGTAATVRYARKVGREIWIIDPIAQSITHEKYGTIISTQAFK